MNAIKSAFLSLLIVLASLSLAPKVVFAAGTCGGYFYGGPCVAKDILVDKLVKEPSVEKGDPEDGQFVDNLGPTDNKYNPEEEVIFKIIVKNTGNTDLSNVEVKDVLPNYLEFVSISAENTSWDKDSKTLTFTTDELKAGESKEFELKAKVVSQDNLPEDKSLLCVTNWVEVKAEDMADSDTSGVCIQNVGILPPTGADPLAIALTLFLGATGLVLIKKNRLA